MAITYGIDSYTKLLINGHGADASTTIFDASGNNKAITCSGNAQIDTAQSKFGGSSLLFDGTGDYLSLADSADWYFDGDFTIDCWIRFNAFPANVGDYATFVSQITDANNRWAFFLRKEASTPTYALRLLTWTSGSAGEPYCTQTAAAFSTGRWYHVALVRSGSDFYIFLDGSQVATHNTATAMPNLSGSLYIGSLGTDASTCMNGWIDEIRISKGIARWTSGFTPPTNRYKGQITDDYDVFLLHANGSDAATYIHDECGYKVTPEGTAQLDTAQKKFGTASILFDGNSDYLTVLDSTEWYFDGDFTIDLQFRISSAPGTGAMYPICGQHDGTNWWYVCYQDDAGTKQLMWRNRYGASVSKTYTWNWTANVDTWYHIAFIRSGNNWMVFVDGTQVGSTTTEAVTIVNTASVLYVGYIPTSYFNGWLDELRISKGIARWTSKFTPPSSEYGSAMTQSMTVANLALAAPSPTMKFVGGGGGGAWVI